MLSQVTRLLALVSAPPLEATTVVHVEVLLLQPQLVMVVVITSTGGVTKRLPLRQPVDPGLAKWAGEYLNETVAGLQLGTALLRRRFEDPGLTARERAFLGALRPAFTELVAARAAALRRRRGRPARRCPRRGARGLPQPARAAREARRAARGARRARSTRGGRSSASADELEHPALRELALVGACYGLVEPHARRRQPGRAGADGLREGDPRRPRRRVRALPLRRGDLRRALAAATTMATTGRDYYELLGVARDASDAEIKKAFRGLARELHPDVSEAPDAEERFREVVEAYEVLSKSETRELYDRYGHAGLRGGGFQPGQLRLRQPLRPLLRVLRRRPVRRRPCGARARRGRRGDDRDRARRGRGRRDARGAVPGRGPVRDAATATAPSPARPITSCPTCGGAGRLQQVSRSVFGEFVRTQACPRCGGSGRAIESPCSDCERRRPRRSRSGRSRSRSRRGSTTASGSASAARATRARSARARATSTCRCACRPTRASSARATTSSRPST